MWWRINIKNVIIQRVKSKTINLMCISEWLNALKKRKLRDNLNMEGRKTATIVGEAVRHTSARIKATCEISAVGYSREDIDVNVLSPSKAPVSYGYAN